MYDLDLTNIDQLMNQFFAGNLSLNLVSARYSREEICDFLREQLGEMESIVESLTPTQLAYRMPGAPAGVDASGDEEHFNTSQIATHVASGITFHWLGMARALGEERPKYVRAPEGVKTTGTKGTILGGGGWDGSPAPELIQLLKDTGDRFLVYVESLPEGAESQATSSFGGVFRDLTPHDWLFLDALHVAMHNKQIREMQAQPDFPSA